MGTKVVYFDESEFSALNGLSMLAQMVYIKFIRWRADYKKQMVGCEYSKLYYSDMAKAVAFMPGKGSTKRAWLPTREELRSAVRELIRAGLIEDAGSSRDKGLVFRLLKMSQPNGKKHNNLSYPQSKNHTTNNNKNKDLRAMNPTNRVMNPTNIYNINKDLGGMSHTKEANYNNNNNNNNNNRKNVDRFSGMKHCSEILTLIGLRK